MYSSGSLSPFRKSSAGGESPLTEKGAAIRRNHSALEDFRGDSGLAHKTGALALGKAGNQETLLGFRPAGVRNCLLLAGSETAFGIVRVDGL